MSRPDTSELERALQQTLPELIAPPSGALLERTLRQVAATPQRRTGAFRIPRLSTRAGWSSMVVAAAAAVAGIVVGGSAVLLIANRPPASPPPATVSPSASATASSSASALPTATPRAVQPEATWERIDLADPAAGVDGGGRPAEIIAFGDRYVVVGSVDGYCGNDILVPAPGCSERLEALTDEPRLQAAAVWISEDARSWDLVESPSFERGRMFDATTDGERIVVAGSVLDSPVVYGSIEGTATVWISTDAQRWEIAASGGPLPEFVEWTPNGWVGVRNTETQGPGFLIADGGPQFLASEDGEVWVPVTEPGDLGPGRVVDLAFDGTGTVIAVGYDEVVTAEGMLDSSTPLSWRTTDGRTWEVAPRQDAFIFDGPAGGLYLQTISATPEGWMALGRADDTPDGVGAWASRDGLTWARLPELSAPGGVLPDAEYVTVQQLFWTDPGLIATGGLPGETGTEFAVWVSADGKTWDLMHRQPGAGFNTLIVDGDLVVSAGTSSASSDNPVPAVYLTTR